MTHMYFSTEGRISYGHLGRTNSCFHTSQPVRTRRFGSVIWPSGRPPPPIPARAKLFLCRLRRLPVNCHSQ